MATAKHKKIDKVSVVSFAVNFCAIFSLIYVVGLLLVANIVGDKRAALAMVSKPLQNCSCPSCGATGTGTPGVETSTAGENVSAAHIVMDDGGFMEKEFNISLTGSGTVEVENRGVNNHSFVIDALKIDSGAIKPGEKKTIVLENLSDAKTYDFYSNIDGDSQAKFNGTINIVP